MENIYIISSQRGQGAPEIHSIWNSYELAIKEYYEYHIRNGYSDRDDTSKYWFMCLYEIPVNQVFANEDDLSKEKFTKSSKHRVKFKNWGELKKEYNVTNRNIKLNEIGI
jgi:hypothetical protein